MEGSCANFDTQLNAQDEPLSQAQLREALHNYDVVCPTVTDQLGQDLFDSTLTNKIDCEFWRGL